MKRLILTFAAILVTAAAMLTPASAALQVDVTQGNAQPLPIAIPDFIAPQQQSDAQAGSNIASVVRADLERSGLFKPLDPKSFIETVRDINVPPNFANWRVINAQGFGDRPSRHPARRSSAR
jgi:TolB protein